MKKKVTPKKNVKSISKKKKQVQKKVLQQKVKVRKLRYGRILLCLTIILLSVYFLSSLININIIVPTIYPKYTMLNIQKTLDLHA